MADIVGDLLIRMAADMTRLDADMKKATATVDGAMGKISASVSLAKKALGAIGVGVGIGALFTLAKNSVNAMAALDDLSEQTGATVEQLSKLERVAAIGGQSMDDVATSFNKLAKSMAEAQDPASAAAAAFKAFGVDPSKFKDAVSLYEALAVAQTKYADSAAKSAAIQQLLGRSGAQQLSTMNDLINKGQNLPTLLGDQAQAAEKLTQSLNELTYGFSMVVRQIMNFVVPALNEATTKFLLMQKTFGSYTSGAWTMAVENKGWADVRNTIKTVTDQIEKDQKRIQEILEGKNLRGRGQRDIPILEAAIRAAKQRLDELKKIDAYYKDLSKLGMMEPLPEDVGGNQLADLRAKGAAMQERWAKRQIQFDPKSGTDANKLLADSERAVDAARRALLKSSIDLRDVNKTLTSSERELMELRESPVWKTFSETVRKQITANYQAAIANEKALQTDKDRAAVISKLSGVSEDFFKTLLKYKAMRDAATISEEQYVEVVNSLIKAQPFATKGFDLEAEARAELIKLAGSEIEAMRQLEASKKESIADINKMDEENKALQTRINMVGKSAEMQELEVAAAEDNERIRQATMRGDLAAVVVMKLLAAQRQERIKQQQGINAATAVENEIKARTIRIAEEETAALIASVQARKDYASAANSSLASLAKENKEREFQLTLIGKSTELQEIAAAERATEASLDAVRPFMDPAEFAAHEKAMRAELENTKALIRERAGMLASRSLEAATIATVTAAYIDEAAVLRNFTEGRQEAAKSVDDFINSLVRQNKELEDSAKFVGMSADEQELARIDMMASKALSDVMESPYLDDTQKRNAVGVIADLITAMRKMIKVRQDDTNALNAQNAATEDLIRKYQSEIDAGQEVVNFQRQQLQTAMDLRMAQLEDNKSLKEEAALIGKTNVQRAIAIEFLKAEKAVRAERMLDKPNEDVIRSIERTRDENVELIKRNDILQQQVNVWGEIESTAHDTFVDILRGGEGVFNRLEAALRDGLYELLWQMTVKKWFINIEAGVSGTLPANMGGLANVPGAAGNLLTGPGSIFGGLSYASGELSAMFATAAGNAALFSGASSSAALSISGAAGMIGQAIPYIGIGLAALSAFGLFDHEPSQVRGRFQVGGTDFEDDASIASRFGPLGFADEDTQYFSGEVGKVLSKTVKGIFDSADKYLDDAAMGRIGERLGSHIFASFEGEYTTEDFLQKYGGTVIRDVASIVLQEINPAMAAFIQTMDGTADEVVAQVNAFLALHEALTATEDSLATFHKWLSDLEAGPLGALERQATQLEDMANAFDGSLESTQALSAGLMQYGQATQAVLQMIEGARRSIEENVDAARRSMIMDTLSPEEQYSFLDKEIAGYLAAIEASTNPEEIARLTSQAVNAASQAWDLLDEEQKTKLVGLYTGPDGVLDKIEQAGDARLEHLQQITIEKADELNDKIAAAVQNGLQPAADSLQNAADNISTINVDVDVTAPSGSSAQVYVYGSEGP